MFAERQGIGIRARRPGRSRVRGDEHTVRVCIQRFAVVSGGEIVPGVRRKRTKAGGKPRATDVNCSSSAESGINVVPVDLEVVLPMYWPRVVGRRGTVGTANPT